MADAVLTQRLLVGASALAGLFVIVLLLVGAFVLLARIVDRFRQANATCEQVGTESTRAVLDTEPGINLSLRDECDRILATPSPFDEAGAERLWAAIRDEQTGEASDA